MRFTRALLLLAPVVLEIFAQAPADAEAALLRELIGKSPRSKLEAKPLMVQRPNSDWTTDYVSSVAIGADGLVYLLHRNPISDPIVVLDESGKIVRSWGRGLYTNPHSLRIDPEGNIWTVDSGSSVVLKFTPEGKQLLRVEIGEIPQGKSGARGAADIAFAGERVFVADGYGNARVIEHDRQGRRVRVWGSAGTGPGQFHLPHAIVARDGVLYVADRQNGRIQRFTLEGKYLGEWTHLGKTFSMAAGPDGNLWIGTHARNVVNEAPGWLVNVERSSGKVLGYVESAGLHSVDVSSSGEVLADPGRGNPNRVMWFRHAR